MSTEAGHAPFLLLSIRAEDAAAYDEYGAVMRFAGLGTNGLQRLRLTHESLGDIDLADWSGIILGGGPYNVSDPVLGCCYGVGTLGSVVGATGDRTYPEPVGALTVTLTEQGRRDPLFAELPDVFDAYGGHKEGASALPQGLACLAYSADCPIQAFRVGDNVYAMQFHPELDADGICTRIDVYKDYGYFAPETAQSLKSAALDRSIDHPPSILRRFRERYARAV